jgi:hypothetical protein
MSKSFRTQPTNIIAQRKIKKNAFGDIEYPRIVSRKPRLGDIHPIDRKLMKTVLQTIPVEFIYGLKKIELRSRQDKIIGEPYGFYRYSERMIVLYSVPSDAWVLDGFTPLWRKAFTVWGAKLEKQGEIFFCSWDKSKLRHFFIAILCHELGHHYTFQYDSKNKLIPDKTTNENLADLHGSRILLTIAEDLKALIGSMEV